MIYHPSDCSPSNMKYVYRLTKDFQVCTEFWWKVTEQYLSFWDDTELTGYFLVSA